MPPCREEAEHAIGLEQTDSYLTLSILPTLAVLKDLVCGPSPQAASSPDGGPAGLQRRHSISICESGKSRRKKSSSPSSAADSACPSSGSGSSASGSPRHSRMEGGGPVSMMPAMMSALNVKTLDEEDNQVHKPLALTAPWLTRIFRAKRFMSGGNRCISFLQSNAVTTLSVTYYSPNHK